MQVEKLESFLELKAQSNQSDKASSESLLNSWLIFATSSTAQGGGGSFKNRKRIGEIDCCE